MNHTEVSVGKVAMNLFVVAPERMTHKEDGACTLDNRVCYVDQYEAMKEARGCADASGRSYCVYKLVDTFTAEPTID